MSEWSAEEFQQFMKAQLGSLELTGKSNHSFRRVFSNESDARMADRPF